MIIFGIQIFNVNASAGSEGAEMEDVVFTATPYTQGLGGQVALDAELSFFGGCCYPLFAYDIKAEIFIPDNVELISGNDIQEIDTVEAVEGGAPTIVHFKWVIKSIVPGDYNIRVNVTTSNCGKSNAEILVRYVEGCSMSIPKVYPDIPNTDRETYVNIDVSSGLEGVQVESVKFFYIKYSNEKNYDTNKIKADNDTLILDGISKKGIVISPERVEYQPDTWKGMIPKQNEECEIYYWIVATDNTGKNTTSVVYSFEVLEIGQIYNFIDVLTWFSIIATIIGIIIIMVYFNKSNTPTLKKNPLLLGSKSLKDLQNNKIENPSNVQTRVQRNIVLILLLIISIIMLIWAIYSGHFEQFAELNGGL
jgi:hypothetical protein